LLVLTVIASDAHDGTVQFGMSDSSARREYPEARFR
jgi:hypothetical protein